MTEPIQNTLVTTMWLDQHLRDRSLRIIDVRGRVLPASAPLPHYYSHHDAYREAHIPGAFFVDWVRDITIDGPQRMQIAPPEKFAAVMSRLGISSRSLVVVYDDCEGMLAARLWWALQYYGHDRVAVLDGGWDKWLAEDRPITREIPFTTASDFAPQVNPALRRTAEDVLAAMNSHVRLIDVRTEGEYHGLISRARHHGHIPGAVNLPRHMLLTPDRTMRPPGIARDLFEAAGVQPTDEVILYCNSGVSASFALLAMRVAGLDGGSVYDGSWKDWGNQDHLPVEV